MKRLGLLLMLASCHSAPAPYGEIVVVVDTDATVPAMISRLRVDLFTESGTWFGSRDYPARDPSDWPLSFSVYSETSAKVRVRLRAFPEGRTRTYAEGPRLLVGGADVTPESEPLPRVTIDRIVSLAIDPSTRNTAKIVLRGACTGSIADLATGSCIEAPPRVALETEVLGAWDDRASNEVGTFRPSALCTDVDPDRICVPGAAFLLGTRLIEPMALVDDALFTAPEVPVRLAPFTLDRTEMTWGRLHALQAKGLAAPMTSDCTPSNSSAEAPVTCIRWSDARAACRFAGGDLPTEAQWEWAATATTDFRSKHRFPWGDAPPIGCTAANVGICPASSGRADAVSGRPWISTDRSPFGASAMVGNVREWTRDAAARFDDAVWLAAPIDDPCIDDPDAPSHVARGLHYDSNTFGSGAFSRTRVASESTAAEIGFRCAYPL